MSETDSTIEFETLVIDNDYEISVDHYPYLIRKKSNKRIVSETTRNDGYKQIRLNKKFYLVHRVIAEQWIENDDPENKTQVDHINHDRSDNRIENLRWVTSSENNKNKSSNKGVVFEYLDNLSEEAFFADDYNEHYFDDLCFDPKTNCFYLYTGSAYKELHYNKRSNGSLYIHVRDIDNVITTITLSKFKQLYELI